MHKKEYGKMSFSEISPIENMQEHAKIPLSREQTDFMSWKPGGCKCNRSFAQMPAIVKNG